MDAKIYERLTKPKMAIAVDFDGTITEKNEYPRIGRIRPYVKEIIDAFQERGYYVYLWTCRTGKELVDAVRFLDKNDIHLDGVNNGPSTGSRKLVANVYIDDAAYPNNGDIDWLEVAASFGIIL